MPKDQWDNAKVVKARLHKGKINALYCYSHVCHLAATATVLFAKKGYPVMEIEGDGVGGRATASMWKSSEDADQAADWLCSRVRKTLFMMQREREGKMAARRAKSDGKSPHRPAKVLVIDVGGTNVKILVTGKREPRKVPSGPDMTASGMVATVKQLAADWSYDVISMGYPGAVLDGRPAAEPKNLSDGWVRFDFAKAFACPVKVVNDAAMQALGGYDGGRMLFLGLGTGLGSALITDGVLVPMELAHLRYRKGRTYEDYVGLRGLKRYGKKTWRRYVADVVAALRDALQADYVVLGGGNAKMLKHLPERVRLGDNVHAFLGGFRLWEEAWMDERSTCVVQRSLSRAESSEGKP